jgi:hypothetical protein
VNQVKQVSEMCNLLIAQINSKSLHQSYHHRLRSLLLGTNFSNRILNILSNSNSASMSLNTNEVQANPIQQQVVLSNKPNKPHNTQKGLFYPNYKSDELNSSIRNTPNIANRTSTMSLSSNVTQYVSNIFNNLTPNNGNSMSKNFISSPISTSI